MIDLHTYLLFICAVIVLVITPGPDMAFILARTVAQGRRAGVFAAIGINAGAYVHVAASVAGLTAVLASSSIAFTAVKWVGAAYLIWIGLQSIVGKSGGLAVGSNSLGDLTYRNIFWQGFWSDALNPKVAIFFLAFLPQFVDAHRQDIGVTYQLLMLGITSNIVAIILNMLLVCLASVATAKLRQDKNVAIWMNRAAGTVFIGLGLRLFGEKL